MIHRHREETVNTQLAILLSRFGVQADAETIQAKGQERPDVLFQWRGLRVVIEGKFADHAGARDLVLNDAQGRVRRGIAHIAAAVVYPSTLRTAATAQLLTQLEQAALSYCIISESEETGWLTGPPAALMEALRRAQETLAQDDLVARTAQSLGEQLTGVALLWMGQAGACDRLSELLGMPAPKGETPEQTEGRRTTAAKVSALVIANALIFQEQLAATDRRVSSLRSLDDQPDGVGAARAHWQWIWQHINYVPIFQLGERVLEELPITRVTLTAFQALLREAQAICAQQSALRHDLMGRIYHWLLHHAKYLGTYYTSVAAATLLLNLTLSRNWNRDFGHPAQLAAFKVADLACGTGTLLMATAQAVTDACILARAQSGRSLAPVDLQTLHRALMENILLADRYHLEIVVSSYDATRPNFSENTDLSELLFIARKKQGAQEAPEPTAYINLWRNPSRLYEALDLAERLKTLTEGIVSTASGSVGEVFHLPATTGAHNWHGVLFARSGPVKAFLALQRGVVQWPGQKPVPITLCPISQLGSLGPDRRRIHEAFDLYNDMPTLHPAFWDHEASKVRMIQQQPNAWLHPRTTPRYADRKATADYGDYPYHLWNMAADILLVERVRTNTHRVLAVGFDQTVLGNTWWALHTGLSPERRKALLLWLNGSLSLLAFFGNRVVTQGAWMQMKKPAWAAMPVLDVQALSDAQAATLAAAYEALSAALDLPDLTPLRAMLAQEPGLTGKSALRNDPNPRIQPPLTAS